MNNTNNMNWWYPEFILALKYLFIEPRFKRSSRTIPLHITTGAFVICLIFDYFVYLSKCYMSVQFKSNSNDTNRSQYHGCRCPGAFVAGSSVGTMPTIGGEQRVWVFETWRRMAQLLRMPFIDHGMYQGLWSICTIVTLFNNCYNVMWYSLVTFVTKTGK